MSVMEQVNLLIEAIKSSDEYSQYHTIKKNIMQDQELYDTMNGFRKENFVLSMSTELIKDESYQKLRGKYDVLLSNQLVNQFLTAEQNYCRLLRNVQGAFIEGVDIDIDFLEE